jgi:hypothetical protein
MKPEASMKLLSEVRDLQIVDCLGRNCGICDDIELSGAPGHPLVVKNLLVGPGAYAQRLPNWAFFVIKSAFNMRLVRVPWAAVESITSRIHLTERAETFGLCRIENRLKKRLKRIPSA